MDGSWQFADDISMGNGGTIFKENVE